MSTPNPESAIETVQAVAVAVFIVDGRLHSRERDEGADRAAFSSGKTP